MTRHAITRHAANRHPLTDEAILDLMRDLARRVGGVPTRTQWRQSGLSPSSTTVGERFGSWSGAVRAAGLVVRERIKDGETRTVVDQLNRGELLIDLARECGVTPSSLSIRVTSYCKRHGLERPMLRRGYASAESLEAEQMADRSRRF